MSVMLDHITRFQKEALLKRLKEQKRFIQVIMGPRQIGKTTMILELLKEIEIPSHFVTADAVVTGNAAWIEQQWESVRLRLKSSGATEYLLVIDEIQKVENWSEIVKAQWDQDNREGTPIKVVLLGSSRLLLQQGLSESLAGRFESTYMGHWSYKEMQACFGWTPEQYAWFGGYPGSAPLIDDEARWKDYVLHSLIEASISRDIIMLTRIHKPALLKRVFQMGCEFSGQVLSYNKILGQLQDAGNTTTIAGYLGLLDTAGLVGGLEKYTGKKYQKRASSPKLQVHNTALISAQRSETYNEIIRKPEIWGRIVESCVGAHLVNHSIIEKFELLHWRDGHDEVDFVLRKGEKLVGLEVKSTAGYANRGMSAFKDQYQPDKIYLVGNNGLPWEEFVAINPADLF